VELRVRDTERKVTRAVEKQRKKKMEKKKERRVKRKSSAIRPLIHALVHALDLNFKYSADTSLGLHGARSYDKVPLSRRTRRTVWSIGLK